MEKLIHKIRHPFTTINFYSLLGIVTAVSVCAAIALEEWFILGVPFLYLLVFQTLVDFKKIYWLLLMTLPLSMEVDVTASLATNLPSEPLMVGLTLVYLFYFAKYAYQWDYSLFKHPIIFMLTVHIVWTFFTMLFSNLPVVSIKFFLAKFWYMVSFVILTLLIVKNERLFKTWFWCILSTLLLTIVIILFRLVSINFAFEDLQEIMQPFYRNHVNYAALQSLFFPFVVLSLTWYKRFSLTWWVLLGALVVLVIGIQFSYTRAAYGGLVIAYGATWVARWRLTRYVMVFAFVVILGGIIFLVNDNRYLEFAPNYDTTVSHTDFNSLVEATYKLEDISTMERVYRWVAAFRMSQDELMWGYGPGNFYNFYKGYTVSKFKTYVSDNPERSGVHSYFVMMLVEQGIIGLVIFIALTFVLLIYAERIYHQTPAANKMRRGIILSIFFSFVLIYSFLLINDLLENDKVGAFYFMNLAILVNMDRLNRKEQRATATDSISISNLSN